MGTVVHTLAAGVDKAAAHIWAAGPCFPGVGKGHSCSLYQPTISLKVISLYAVEAPTETCRKNRKIGNVGMACGSAG